MLNSNSKIIVKVGKKSEIKFNSHVKTIRAVTAEELQKLIKLHNDCHLLIIEGIYADEVDKTGEVINQFKSEDTNNTVLFYCVKDPITSGLADSLNYNICSELDELYSIIKKSTGINASIFLKDKSNQLESIDSNDIFGTPENADDIETMKSDIADTISEIDRKDSEAVEVVDENKGDDISDIFGNSENIDNNLSISESDYDISNSSGDGVKTSPGQNVDYSDIDSDINIENLKDVSEDVNKLITALANSKIMNNSLRKDIKRLGERNAELEELVVTLTDKNESLITEYYNIVTSGEVFEDPVTLSEYQMLQEKIEEHQNSNIALKNQIVELKEKIKKKEDTVLNNLAEIGKLSYEVDSLTQELDTLKIKIESGEIHTEIIADYEERLGDISLTNEKLARLYKEVSDQNKADEELIGILRSNLDIEVACRYKTVKLFKHIFKHILDDKAALEKAGLTEQELRDKYTELEITCDDLREQLEESGKTNVSLQTTVDGLNSEVESLKENIKTLNDTIDSLNADKKSLEEEKTKLEEKLKEEKEKLEGELADVKKESGESASKAAEEISGLKSENDDLKAANSGLTSHVENLTKKLTDAQDGRTTAEDKVKELEGKINTLNNEIAEYNSTIDELSEVSDTLKIRESTITSLEEKIGTLNGYLSEKDMLLAEKDKEIQKITVMLSGKDSSIAEKDKEIEELKASLKQSEASLNTIREKLNKEAGSSSAKDTQLSDLKGEIDGLKKKLDAKKLELAGSTKSNNDLKGDIVKLNAKISELEAKIAELTAKEKTANDRLARAGEELKKAKKELSDEKAAHTATKDELDTANVTIGVQQTQLEAAKKSLESKNGEIQESKGEYNSLKDDLADAQIKLSTAENTIKTNETKFKNALVAKDNEHKKAVEGLNNTIADKDSLIDTLTAQLKTANVERAKSAAALKAKEGEISRIKTDLELKEDALSKADKRLEEERQRFKKSLDTLKAGAINIDLNGDGTVSQDEIKEANRKIRTLENDLTLANTTIETLESELTKLRDSSGDFKKIKELTASLQQVTEQNEKLSAENTEIAAENATNKATMVQQRTEIAGLKAMITEAQQRSTGESFEIKPIKYKGAAKIVTAFGSGSHGVTTAAMSVATKLAGTTRVVYLDFDLVSPSADSWLRTSPIAKKFNMTAFNIFVDRGVDFIEDNIKDVIIKTEKTKGGGFDYFSGMYDIVHRFGEEHIANADFSALFNMLSRHYDYIVVDLGTLGSSSLTDSMICNITATTHCNIAVTTSDQFEIRNFGNKLEGLALSNNSVSWLVNMCPSNNWQGVPQKMMDKYISKYKYAFIYDDPSIRGMKEKFGNGGNRQNRDTFDFFMMSSVFGD